MSSYLDHTDTSRKPWKVEGLNVSLGMLNSQDPESPLNLTNGNSLPWVTLLWMSFPTLGCCPHNAPCLEFCFLESVRPGSLQIAQGPVEFLGIRVSEVIWG